MFFDGKHKFRVLQVGHLWDAPSLFENDKGEAFYSGDPRAARSTARGRSPIAK